MIDLHNHILWGVDDGSKDIEESIEMAKEAEKDGIKTIAATPHYMEGSFRESSTNILEKIQKLNRLLEEKNIDIEIIEGQEVFLSVDIIKHLDKKELITINKSKYLLIEFSMLNIPTNADKMINKLMKKGIRPIIAHPERVETIIREPSVLIPFIEMGCLTQVNAGSIKGYFGDKIKKTAIELIERDMVYIIASDAHNAHRRKPQLSEAYEKIEEIKDKEYVEKLKKTAEKIIKDEDIEFIEPKVTVDKRWRNSGLSIVKRWLKKQ